MNQESGKSLAVALGVALLAGLGVGAGPVTAQEEGEDDRRERVSILSSGSGGYLGVEIRDVDEERASDLGMPRPYGAFVSDVVAEGPADEAGLNNGDVIVRWNGARLESVAQLQRLAGETPPGREVQLTVLRDGAERELSVELGSRRSWLSQAVQGGLVVNPLTSRRGLTWLAPPSVQIQPGRTGANIRFFGRPRLGVNVQTLGDQLADYFGVEGGALVTSVSEDSPAAAAGLLAGDVIVGIDDEDGTARATSRVCSPTSKRERCRSASYATGPNAPSPSNWRRLTASSAGAGGTTMGRSRASSSGPWTRTSISRSRRSQSRAWRSPRSKPLGSSSLGSNHFRPAELRCASDRQLGTGFRCHGGEISIPARFATVSASA